MTDIDDPKVATLRTAPPAGEREDLRYCAPADIQAPWWLLWFEDDSREPEIYELAGEDAARRRWAEATAAGDRCHLLQLAPREPMRYSAIATLIERNAALGEEVERMRATLGDHSDRGIEAVDLDEAIGDERIARVVYARADALREALAAASRAGLEIDARIADNGPGMPPMLDLSLRRLLVVRHRLGGGS